MKKAKNHMMHFALILLMLLVSFFALQHPSTHQEPAQDSSSTVMHEQANTRIQSLLYTKNVNSIIDGIARYFIGTMNEALAALSVVKHSPLSTQEKKEVLFGLVEKLRSRKTDQVLVCKYIMNNFSLLSKEPLLYAAAKSPYPPIVKDIIEWATDHTFAHLDTLVFNAFDYAIKKNDLKSIEQLYLNGASLNKIQACQLLKDVVCGNKKIEMAKFFIERTHADPYYVDNHNTSVMSYALYHHNNAFIHAVKNSKKNAEGTITTFC